MSGVLGWYHAIALKQATNLTEITLYHQTGTARMRHMAHNRGISEEKQVQAKSTDVNPFTSKDDIYSAERVTMNSSLSWKLILLSGTSTVNKRVRIGVSGNAVQ